MSRSCSILQDEFNLAFVTQSHQFVIIAPLRAIIPKLMLRIDIAADCKYDYFLNLSSTL